MEPRNTEEPQAQLQSIWDEIRDSNNSAASTDAISWPSYDTVMNGVAKADYNHTLSCPFDTANSGESAYGKTLCPHGVVCCVQMEIFDSPRNQYSGLLGARGSKNCGLLRLSSAMRPPSSAHQSRLIKTLLYATGEKIRNSQLFPCAAIKIFRKNVPSGNLLFGGSKVGQREKDYFSHCQCTTMTERMPRLLKPFVQKFWRYSDYPLSLGVSDFCRYGSSGEESDKLNFPFAVVLCPLVSFGEGGGNDSFDNFITRTIQIPEETKLFDIYCCPTPSAATDPSQLERIGTITSASGFIRSSPSDGLFFRHQRKEDDYALRPDWADALQTKVTLDGGRVSGTVGQIAGWKLFEQHIEKGGFQDFATA